MIIPYGANIDPYNNPTTYSDSPNSSNSDNIVEDQKEKEGVKDVENSSWLPGEIDIFEKNKGELLTDWVKWEEPTTNRFLLRMIEWHTQAENGWYSSIPPIGKRMCSWVTEELWKDLHVIFAHFDAEDSWKALFYTMELFKHLMAETAQSLQLSSMEELSEKMMGFITTLKSSPL